MKIVTAFALAVVLAARIASAASPTPQQAFEKLVGKYAATGGAKDKALCVCLDDGAFFYGAAGYVRQTTEFTTGTNLVVLSCVIQGFDEVTGVLEYQAGCIPFAALAR